MDFLPLRQCGQQSAGIIDMCRTLPEVNKEDARGQEGWSVKGHRVGSLPSFRDSLRKRYSLLRRPLLHFKFSQFFPNANGFSTILFPLCVSR